MIFSSPTFWLILGVLTLVAWGSMKTLLRKVPIVNNQKTLLLIAVAGLAITTGFVGSLGLGSIGTSSNAPANFVVSDLQLTIQKKQLTST